MTRVTPEKAFRPQKHRREMFVWLARELENGPRPYTEIRDGLAPMIPREEALRFYEKRRRKRKGDVWPNVKASSRTKRMAEILREGPARERDIVSEMAKKIPPGRALRRREHVRLRMEKMPSRALITGVRSGPREVSEAYAIKVGERLIVRSNIEMAIKTGYVERFRNEDNERWLRLTPKANDPLRLARRKELSPEQYGQEMAAARLISDAVARGLLKREGGRGSGTLMAGPRMQDFLKEVVNTDGKTRST